MVISCGAATIVSNLVSPNPIFILAATQNGDLAETTPPLLVGALK
jgi:hypothetical protein